MDMNLELVHQAAPHVAAVKPHIHHAVKQAAHIQGISMLTTVISTTIGVVIAGVVGFFVGKRGLIGTKSDITNAVTSTEKVITAAETAAHPAA